MNKHKHKPYAWFRNICSCGAFRTGRGQWHDDRCIIAPCERPLDHASRGGWVVSWRRESGLIESDDASPHFPNLRLAIQAIASKVGVD